MNQQSYPCHTGIPVCHHLPGGYFGNPGELDITEDRRPVTKTRPKEDRPLWTTWTLEAVRWLRRCHTLFNPAQLFVTPAVDTNSKIEPRSTLPSTSKRRRRK